MSANVNIQIPAWTIAEETGYEPQTTFWQDFWIASTYGAIAVQDTYNKAITEWLGNHIFMAELSLVLNHMYWLQHRKKNKPMEHLFFQLCETHMAWCNRNLKGEALAYYKRVTDL